MEELGEISLAYYLICLFILGIVFILILSTLNSRKKALLEIRKKDMDFESALNRVQLRSIEEERRKLGSILHDDLGQLLTLIHMQIAELKKDHRDKEMSNTPIKMLEDLCNTASEKCSSISKMLFPASLIRLGFVEGLHELISDIQHATGIHIVFKYDEFPISDERSSNLYRIFQELLNNTIKHANASEIMIDIANISDNIRVVYSDNGIGLNAQRSVEGLGTTTIKTRLHILGGEIIASNQDQRGFKMTFTLPHGDD